jgi:hypothetical protein
VVDDFASTASTRQDADDPFVPRRDRPPHGDHPRPLRNRHRATLRLTGGSTPVHASRAACAAPCAPVRRRRGSRRVIPRCAPFAAPRASNSLHIPLLHQLDKLGVTGSSPVSPISQSAWLRRCLETCPKLWVIRTVRGPFLGQACVAPVDVGGRLWTGSRRYRVMHLLYGVIWLGVIQRREWRSMGFAGSSPARTRRRSRKPRLRIAAAR